MHSTKQRLIEAGLKMLLEQGYNSLGLDALLSATRITKGSFYHHFHDKEDFALAVIDAYFSDVHMVLETTLTDASRPPLQRVRNFFLTVQGKYAEEGYLGCLMGGLGQELSGVNEAFRQKIEWCFTSVAQQLAACIEVARDDGSLPASIDPKKMAELLVDCWEGAALRSRLRRDPSSLIAMLDFCLGPVAADMSNAGRPRQQ